MIKKILTFLLVILLLADTGYSFLQHYHVPFDGDMAGGIVPADDVKPILESPLGLKIFTEDIIYPNPNRYFSHWFLYNLFTIPTLFFQNFTNSIDSAYLSVALVKTIIQLALIVLLAFAISGNKSRFEILLSAVLVAPLFQTNGYQSYMGIIDQAATYNMFYSLPTVILLIYFAPIFLRRFHGMELKGFKYFKILWIPLAVITSLSGPLNPGISLVICLLLITHSLYTGFKTSQEANPLLKFIHAVKAIPGDYYFFLLPIGIFSMYSLFLGRYNLVDLSHQMSLATLYSRLPEGIYYSFTQKLGFPLLFIILLINTIIIKTKFNNEEGKKILDAFKWIGIFSLIYILLLPLGGYRDYRQHVLRYDTIIPITLCLIFIFGKTTLFIFKNFSRRQNTWYIPLIGLILLVFTNADNPGFDKNESQKKAIIQIANSPETIVEIDNNCTVLSWALIENPQESALNVKLLRKWRILDKDKLYYQKRR